jgi:hypothetical protein
MPVRARRTTFVTGLLFLSAAPSALSQVPAGYAGKAWHDTVQTVPGKIQPERYDDGASGSTWYDTGPHIGAYTARNSPVDLDPVKSNDPTVATSAVKAVPGEIYWGWLEAGEWLKFTVDVKQPGAYSVHAMVGTAMTGTSFRIDALQGADSVSSGTLVLPFAEPCPVECYHYWNFAKDVGTIKLKAGLQVLRIQIVKSGYNIEYVELQPADGTGLRGQSEGKGGKGDNGGKAFDGNKSFQAADPAIGFDASGRKHSRPRGFFPRFR